MMMTDQPDYASLAAHLRDLEDHALNWYQSSGSSFLNEEEQAVMQKEFPPSALIRYDGGYPGAQKKKVIFLADEEDDFSDITCLKAHIDQRFRKIGHRDILGALMHLQIDRHSFGDFWIDGDWIYLYTSESMAPFLIDNLTRINQLNVHFKETDERPVQQFHTKRMQVVIASERMDAVIAGIVHCSRSEAKKMIQEGLVQVNHLPLEHPDKLCDNNSVISVRGYGRYRFLGVLRKTRSDRLVAVIEQSI